MTEKQRDEVTKISQEFASGFDYIPLNGSEWLIVDPLSAYLNIVGYPNKLEQYPRTEKHPMVLIMTFEDGTKFIPAGEDLKPIDKRFTNWIWI